MPVIFPDVEMWACGAIRTGLTTYLGSAPYVGNLTPNPRPSRFVTVRNDGGPSRDYVLEDPRIGVTVWGTDEQDVSKLARTVSAVLRASADSTVTSIRQQLGPVPIADDSGQACRYMTFQLTTKGEDLAIPPP